MTLYDEVNEHELVLRRCDDDDPAFSQACHCLSLLLRSVLVNQRHNPELAEMLALEVTTEIIMKVDRYGQDKPGSFAGSCVTLALNHFRNWIRGESRHNHVSDEALDAWTVSDTEWVVDDDEFADALPSLSSQLMCRFTKLDDGDRRLLEMRILKDVSLDDRPEPLKKHIAIRLDELDQYIDTHAMKEIVSHA